MNPVICASCLEIYDQVMNSALGKAFITKLSETVVGNPEEINFISISEKLLQNKYTQPHEWIDEFEMKVQNLFRICPINSEISIAAQALLYRIKENSKFLFNGSDEEWIEACKNLKSTIQDNLSSIPNSLEEFKALPKPNVIQEELRPKRPNSNLQQPTIPTNELIEIKNCIQRLRSDEEVHTIVEILSKYEHGILRSNKVIEFDLKKCSPSTISLIRAHILRCLGSNALNPKIINPPHRSTSVNIIKNTTMTESILSQNTSKLLQNPNSMPKNPHSLLVQPQPHPPAMQRHLQPPNSNDQRQQSPNLQNSKVETPQKIEPPKNV